MNGMIFGIIKQSDVYRKWGHYSPIVLFNKIYKIRLNSEIDKEAFKHLATVRFLGNYQECSTKFTELWTEYSKKNLKLV